MTDLNTTAHDQDPAQYATDYAFLCELGNNPRKWMPLETTTEIVPADAQRLVVTHVRRTAPNYALDITEYVVASINGDEITMFALHFYGGHRSYITTTRQQLLAENARFVQDQNRTRYLSVAGGKQ